MNRVVRTTSLIFIGILITAFLVISCRTESTPVIGISASKPASAGGNYVKAVRKAGGIPLIIPITSDAQELEEILERVDGIIMTGGEDVEPARYGEEALPELGKTFPERDEFDIKLISMAAEEGLPILGICRGAQVLNVAFGGTLYQDIPSQLPDTFINHRVGARNEVMHSVRITEGTILHSILGETAGVNTSHHQAVKDVAPGFVISAVSEDGVVEAIEKSDAECIIGVQFHPEAFVADGNDSLLPVFTYFIKATSSSR